MQYYIQRLIRRYGECTLYVFIIPIGGLIEFVKKYFWRYYRIFIYNNIKSVCTIWYYYTEQGEALCW